MQKARVANPGPAGLLVINPTKRGSKMATKRRRRSTTKRRTTAARRNPTATITRRKRRTRRSNPGVFASSRRRTTRRRSVGRRRNPATSLLSKGLVLAGGGAAVQFVQGFIPPIGGSSPLADAGRTAATGYLLGMAMRKTGFGARYADDVQLAGFTVAGAKVIAAFVLPAISGFFRPAPQTQPVNAGGMNDLVTLPAGNYDPYYGSTPRIGASPVRTNKAAALKDLLTMPAMPGAYQRFGR